MDILAPVLANSGDDAVGFIGVVAVVVFVLIIKSVKRSGARENLRVLASRLGGSAMPEGLHALPTIDCLAQGYRARIQLRDGKEPRTQLQIVVPQLSAGWMRIATERLGPESGTATLAVGEPFFDADYTVQARPPDLAHSVFDPLRRTDVVQSVRRLECPSGLVLTVEAGRIEIELRECIRDDRRLRSLMGTAADFVRYVTTRPEEEPILWSESSESSEGRCPVCTARLSEPLIRCDSCRSPHHRECWEYLGRCATYGCDPKPGRRAA